MCFFVLSLSFPPEIQKQPCAHNGAATAVLGILQIVLRRAAQRTQCIFVGLLTHAFRPARHLGQRLDTAAFPVSQ